MVRATVTSEKLLDVARRMKLPMLSRLVDEALRPGVNAADADDASSSAVKRRASGPEPVPSPKADAATTALPPLGGVTGTAWAVEAERLRASRMPSAAASSDDLSRLGEEASSAVAVAVPLSADRCRCWLAEIRSSCAAEFPEKMDPNPRLPSESDVGEV